MCLARSAKCKRKIKDSRFGPGFFSNTGPHLAWVGRVHALLAWLAQILSTEQVGVYSTGSSYIVDGKLNRPTCSSKAKGAFPFSNSKIY